MKDSEPTSDVSASFLRRRSHSLVRLLVFGVCVGDGSGDWAIQLDSPQAMDSLQVSQAFPFLVSSTRSILLYL